MLPRPPGGGAHRPHPEQAMLARTTLGFQIDSQRHAPVSRTEFAEAFSRLTSHVCIVGACEDGMRSGRTATAVISLAADPPTVLVSINRGGAMAGLIERTQGFSVAMLAEGQHAVADTFAGKVDPGCAALSGEERFTVGEWSSWPSGRPRLTGAVAGIDCDLIGMTDIATHVLFMGLIVRVETTDGLSPLLWGMRGYRNCVPAP